MTALIGYEWLSTLSNAFAGLIGIFFMYCGYFLYENEEKIIHNKLEDLWIYFDEKGKKAVNGHATILQKMGLVAKTGINKIFSDKTWSLQNLVSTCCLSFLSISALIVFAKQGLTLHYFLLHNVGQVCYAVSMFTLLIIPLHKRFPQCKRAWLYTAFLASAVYACQIVSDTFNFGKESPFLSPDINISEYLLFHIPIFLFAQAVMMLFPNLFRTCIDLSVIRVNAKSNKHHVVILLAIFALVAFTVSTCLTRETYSNGTTYFGIVAHSPFDLAICYLGVYGLAWICLVGALLGLVAFLGLHLLLWGVIKRPIYSLARHKVFNYHKSLFMVGLALLGYSIHKHGISFPQIGMDIIKAFE